VPTRFLTSNFNPEEIRVMTAAFEAACRILGVQPGNPLRDDIARKIFEAAQQGERDPERLRQIGMTVG
jgi:hypothetical protein